MFSKLQYISRGSTAKEQVENIQKALDAGCQWIQLRFKNAGESEIIKVAEQVKNYCTSYNAIFIINDNVDVANKVDASGVHLGLDDMPVTRAKIMLSAGKIIGGTANTSSDILRRVEEKCDYIGLGPFRFTSTKEKLSPVLGLEGYENILNELSIKKINIPIYAIGGIQMEDIEEIMNKGVYGIAVSGAITKHPRKKEWIRKFNSLLHEKVNNSR